MKAGVEEEGIPTARRSGDIRRHVEHWREGNFGQDPLTLMKKKLITLVVACYNEQDNILSMHERIKKVFTKLPLYDYEIIYVDNASVDNSENILTKLAKKDKKVKVILMSRNFGTPQPSFIAGLEHATGDAAVLLHGDIQDPPEVIPKFIQKWQEGYDVVYGVIKHRKGYNFIWNFFYRFFYYLLHKLAYINIPLDSSDFSLMDRNVLAEFLKIEEHEFYIRCLRAYVGFKQIGVTYERQPRTGGTSSQNFISSAGWAKSIIINFSFKPINWITQIAFIILCSSFLLFIVEFISISLFKKSLSGISITVILMLFLGSIQLFSLGIVAEYIGKIYLEVKKRPRYIIRKILNE